MSQSFTPAVVCLEARATPNAASATVDLEDPAAEPLATVTTEKLNPIAVGSDAGDSQFVKVFDTDGSERMRIELFGATGGSRTAVGDVNGDGVGDIIVGAGPGSPPRVQIFDGTVGTQLADFLAFEESFTGGVYVAAGELGGPTASVVITPDEGGGPRVRVLDGADLTVVADFFGIADPDFRGGARTAVGDIDGDGETDLLVGAGFGGGPRVAGYDGASLLTGEQRKLFPDFFAFEQTLRNGVFLASGDLNADGADDLIFGGGPGGGPRIFALSGRELVNNELPLQLANFFAGDAESRGGVRVAVNQLDGDAHADLVVGSGSGAGTRVVGYSGFSLAPRGEPTTLLDFEAFAGRTSGVFVG